MRQTNPGLRDQFRRDTSADALGDAQRPFTHFARVEATWSWSPFIGIFRVIFIVLFLLVNALPRVAAAAYTMAEPKSKVAPAAERPAG